MSGPLTRRRFLAIAASAAAAPALAGTASAHWRGTALGAGASLRLEGIAQAEAEPILAAVADELRRLERIFSLYDGGSSLSRLNRDGRLDHPPAEMLELLSLCDRLHSATGGAFDPTIQPLWQFQAEAAAGGETPDETTLRQVRARTGWDDLRFGQGVIAFERPGMAMTLNGIAQGYITDRIRTLLLENGLRDILIDMGEIAANGTRSDGRAWVAGVARPNGQVIRRVTLKDRALATSAPFGTVLDAEGKVGHILDPETGMPARQHGIVSVSAGTAALADGLSTGLCLIPASEASVAINSFPGARLEVMA